MKTKPFKDQSFRDRLQEIDDTKDKVPPVTPKNLSERLKKRFGDNWNREYSPTGDIRGKLDKMRKIKKVRKGGPVGHSVGDQVTPNPMGGNLGGPQMKPSIPSPQVPKQAASKEKPPSQQDTMNQKIDAVNKAAKAEADQNKYKKMASLGQPQAPGQPQAQPQAPGKPQPQRPPVLSRKGDTVKTQGYRGGGKVYSNACRAANNPVA
jgi:hypothetical protein